MSTKKIPSTKPDSDLPPGVTRTVDTAKPIWGTGQVPAGMPAAIVNIPPVIKSAPEDEMLLVCLQDPFEGIAKGSARMFDTKIQASDNNPSHKWRLRSTLEMNPVRFFESWATRGNVTLDIRVSAMVSEDAGAWGGNVQTFTSPGQLRVVVMRGLDNKVKFSLASGAVQATEKILPNPDSKRYLNADVGFELNGEEGITFGASAVISFKNRSNLIAGSMATTRGFAFDGNWRGNLALDDGDSVAMGAWAFSVVSRQEYRSLCNNLGWTEHIVS